MASSLEDSSLGILDLDELETEEGDDETWLVKGNADLQQNNQQMAIWKLKSFLEFWLGMDKSYIWRFCTYLLSYGGAYETFGVSL